MTLDELRAITVFNLACAEQVIDVLERIQPDTAASAYLHPLADPAQVDHILRGPAYCVLALQHRPVEPLSRSDAVAAVLQCASPQVIDVLMRYPRVRPRRQEVASVMSDLDARLRGDLIQ